MFLKKMAMVVVAAVVMRGVCGNEPAHLFRQAGAGAVFQEQMKMRVPQATGMNPALEHLQVFGEIFQKGAAIQAVAKGDVAGIYPGNEVIDGETDPYVSVEPYERLP